MPCTGCQRRKEKLKAVVVKAKTAIERIRQRVDARKALETIGRSIMATHGGNGDGC